MKSVIDIADALTKELNAAPDGTFSLPVKAVRVIVPEYDLRTEQELKVSVVPKGMTAGMATRANAQLDMQVDVGVQMKIAGSGDTALQAQVETLAELVEEIADYTRRLRLADMPGVVWTAVENDPIYDPKILAGTRTFQSVLTITYRGIKSGAST